MNKITICWITKVILAISMPLLYVSLVITFTLSSVGITSEQYPSIINVNNNDMVNLAIFTIAWIGIELFHVRKEYNTFKLQEGDPLR